MIRTIKRLEPLQSQYDTLQLAHSNLCAANRSYHENHRENREDRENRNDDKFDDKQ